LGVCPASGRASATNILKEQIVWVFARLRGERRLRISVVPGTVTRQAGPAFQGFTLTLALTNRGRRPVLPTLIGVTRTEAEGKRVDDGSLSAWEGPVASQDPIPPQTEVQRGARFALRTTEPVERASLDVVIYDNWKRPHRGRIEL
jgi:hypothetical protein